MKSEPRTPAAIADPLVTMGDWLRYAIRLYEQEKLALGQIATTAHDEALYLLLHTVGLPLDSEARVLDRKITTAQRTKIEAMLRRRVIERVPAAYLTREAWLGDKKFYVDERVIIPRSYFLEIIPQQLDGWLREPGKVANVVDVCTGSGCLAILAAQAFPNADVDAVDISAEALEVARINVADYGLDDRIALFHGDLFAPLAQRRYDVIIANPPYVNSESMQALPAEYRHEPELALAGGADGMDVVRRIIGEAPNWLTDEGVLVVEIGNERANVEAAFGGLDLVWLSTSGGDDNVFLIQAADLPAV